MDHQLFEDQNYVIVIYGYVSLFPKRVIGNHQYMFASEMVRNKGVTGGVAQKKKKEQKGEREMEKRNASDRFRWPGRATSYHSSGSPRLKSYFTISSSTKESFLFSSLIYHGGSEHFFIYHIATVVRNLREYLYSYIFFSCLKVH